MKEDSLNELPGSESCLVMESYLCLSCPSFLRLGLTSTLHAELQIPLPYLTTRIHLPAKKGSEGAKIGAQVVQYRMSVVSQSGLFRPALLLKTTLAVQLLELS